MRRPALSEDLVPVNEFRANMASYIQRVSESGRPVVLTQHGRATAVLVDPALLDEIEESREVVLKVMQGLADGASGRVVGTDELFDELFSLRTAVATPPLRRSLD